MTVVIGKRSNLSNKLLETLNNSISISSEDIEDNIDMISKNHNGKINIIFNNFQTSILLNDNSDYEEYIKKTILDTATVLNYISHNKISINKIIYTSSSSVYGNNKYCTEEDLLSPMNLQGSLKVANEELIKRFCNLNDINFTIVRLFNIYGGNDRFSIVSKIKDAYLNNKVLTIINEGKAVRDYIFIDDVAKVYKRLIDELDVIPNIINVANGNGIKVSDILNYLKEQGIVVKTKNVLRDEINTSIANVSKLNSIININTFMNVEDFVLQEIRDI